MAEPEQEIYLTITMTEFEWLHAEVRRLRDGWSDAEAQIAVLRTKIDDLYAEMAASEYAARNEYARLGEENEQLRTMATCTLKDHEERERLRSEVEVLTLANQTFTGTFEELARLHAEVKRLQEIIDRA